MPFFFFYFLFSLSKLSRLADASIPFKTLKVFPFYFILLPFVHPVPFPPHTLTLQNSTIDNDILMQ
ncbi:MAG: hypothetical protein A3G23_14150 [Bacteroidetes bacterium RIFCSPLOWO2_12_FULL_37_12]|nr:MAG: hypothetical protein A3G23_14150 [Bacteroidetes bacterium RIFCSPLOWO2_12_FULL_37_12]